MAPSKNPLVRLGHIRDEISDLSAALDGITYEMFEKNYMLRRMAEHALLIISEAVKALSPTVTDHHPGIEWRASLSRAYASSRENLNPSGIVTANALNTAKASARSS